MNGPRRYVYCEFFKIALPGVVPKQTNDFMDIVDMSKCKFLHPPAPDPPPPKKMNGCLMIHGKLLWGKFGGNGVYYKKITSLEDCTKACY